MYQINSSRKRRNSKTEKSAFGELLTEMIEYAKLTQSEFYLKLGISKPYFYDILLGKIKPPPAEMQFKMIKILNPTEEKRKKFFDLAAKGREEMPADIKQYLTMIKLEEMRLNKDFNTVIGTYVNEIDI